MANTPVSSKRHMKASVVSAYGGPEVMKYQDMPDPELGVGDVLVKVAGIGINPEDMLERNGDLKDRWPMHFPAIIGLDVSGTVVATGDGVTDLKVGDRVCAWSYHTYAELVADKATLFAKVPETMDLVDAAAIPLVGVTGSQLISVASGLQSGQTVLVSGAAGAVGRCAVYMAKVSGGARDRGRASVFSSTRRIASAPTKRSLSTTRPPSRRFRKSTSWQTRFAGKRRRICSRRSRTAGRLHR